MKKQILFLAMFTLALIFAGTMSYAQDINYINAASTGCPTPTLLPCATDDALHPLPGKTYTYTVTVAPGVTTGYINWFVTDASAVIGAGGVLTADIEPNGGTSPYLLSAPAAKYNSITNTSPTIDVSWQSFNGTSNNVLLVAFVKGENGCSDNIEVYKIEPSFAFTLDIAGLLPTGLLPASGNANECATPVQQATYTVNTLTMDYGDNYIFYAVNAANFVNSWQPTFTIPANTTTTPAAVADIQWAYPAQAILAAGTWNAANAPVIAQASGGAVGKDGECIIVRVHLDHGNHDNAVAGAVTVGVDGIMYNIPTSDYSNTNLKDLDPSAVAPCTNTATDQATYDLTPRPRITAVAPVPFVPKN